MASSAEFTDIGAAIEEAHYMQKKNCRNYIVIQLALGMLRVIRVRGQSSGVMYSTEARVKDGGKWVADLKPLSLAYSHRNAA